MSTLKDNFTRVANLHSSIIEKSKEMKNILIDSLKEFENNEFVVGTDEYEDSDLTLTLIVDE